MPVLIPVQQHGYCGGAVAQAGFARSAGLAATGLGEQLPSECGAGTLAVHVATAGNQSERSGSSLVGEGAHAPAGGGTGGFATARDSDVCVQPQQSRRRRWGAARSRTFSGGAALPDAAPCQGDTACTPACSATTPFTEPRAVGGTEHTEGDRCTCDTVVVACQEPADAILVSAEVESPVGMVDGGDRDHRNERVEQRVKLGGSHAAEARSLGRCGGPSDTACATSTVENETSAAPERADGSEGQAWAAAQAALLVGSACTGEVDARKAASQGAPEEKGAEEAGACVSFNTSLWAQSVRPSLRDAEQYFMSPLSARSRSGSASWADTDEWESAAWGTADAFCRDAGLPDRECYGSSSGASHCDEESAPLGTVDASAASGALILQALACFSDAVDQGALVGPIASRFRQRIEEARSNPGRPSPSSVATTLAELDDILKEATQFSECGFGALAPSFAEMVAAPPPPAAPPESFSCGSVSGALGRKRGGQKHKRRRDAALPT